MHKTVSIHHHHPEGVVYRSCCFNSVSVAVSKVPSRRWCCIDLSSHDSFGLREGGELETLGLRTAGRRSRSRRRGWANLALVNLHATFSV